MFKDEPLVQDVVNFIRHPATGLCACRATAQGEE
jgi:hypothetical protein